MSPYNISSSQDPSLAACEIQDSIQDTPVNCMGQHRVPYITVNLPKLTDRVDSHTQPPRKSLLVFPKTRYVTSGHRALSSAGPELWNSSQLSLYDPLHLSDASRDS